MSKLSYMLEVYEPNSDDTVICSYSSDTVFPTISVGEVLNFVYLEEKVQAKEIIHLIWENEERVSFKTMIFTEIISS